MGMRATAKSKHSVRLPCDFGTYSPLLYIWTFMNNCTTGKLVLSFLLKYNTLPSLIFIYIMSLGLTQMVSC